MIRSIIKHFEHRSGIPILIDCKDPELVNPLDQIFDRASYYNPDISRQIQEAGKKIPNQRRAEEEYVFINFTYKQLSEPELAHSFFHEIAHATGKSGRLSRKVHTHFLCGEQNMREKEELIAEFAANLLLELFGLHSEKTLAYHALYIGEYARYVSAEELNESIRKAGEATSYILTHWINEIEFLQLKVA